MKTSKRFSSEKSAYSFALKVDGQVKDLRAHPERKSNFKVTYEKKYRNHFDGYQEWYDEASMDGSLAYNGVADDF